MQEIELIQKLIGEAKLKKAISELLKLETDYTNIIIGLQSRLNILEKKEVQSIISSENANLERNLIINSLLKIASEITTNKSPIEDPGNVPTIENSANEPSIDITDNESFEKIIGSNGLKRIDWLSKGLEKAKSVCKIHTADGYVGTGFLIEGGFIFTNNHVIGSASIAQYSKVEFGYDSPDVPSVFYELDHANFTTSVLYDYTKVKVKDTHPKIKLAHWGELQINNNPPDNNDALVIIQHPQGRQKELAFSDGDNSNWEHRLHYKVTTEPGSSGSPVFDLEWNVIAIHHAGGNLIINAQGDKKYVNEGILFNYIQKEIDENNSDDNQIKKVKPEENIQKPIKSILVYNSKDSEYADGLFSHLYSQIRNGNIVLLDIQNDIPPDADKQEFLIKELESSTIIFILISRNLYSRETIKIALDVEKQVSNKRVIPIRVSPFDLDGTPFERLQGLPISGGAISDSDDIDNILYEIVNSINRVIKSILKL